MLAITDHHETCTQYCNFEFNCGEVFEIRLQELEKWNLVLVPVYIIILVNSRTCLASDGKVSFGSHVENLLSHSSAPNLHNIYASNHIATRDVGLKIGQLGSF